MTVRRTAPQRTTLPWTGIGLSLGAGLGLVAGVIGWGASGVALGTVVGAGVGVALGAGRESLGRAEREQGSDAPEPRA